MPSPIPRCDLAETRLDPGVAAGDASDGAGGERLAACIPGATRSQEERHLDTVLGAEFRHLRDLCIREHHHARALGDSPNRDLASLGLLEDSAEHRRPLDRGDLDAVAETVREACVRHEGLASRSPPSAATRVREQVRVEPMLPIDRPGKIVCVGLNYRDHAEEQGVELPKEPLLFAKWPNALVGPGEPIVIPPLVTKCDYEAELGVVIGTRVKAVSKENAFEAVRGYICANDVSARDLQFSDGQWTRGKSPDTFCPIGPALVPASDVPDPHNLRIRAIVSGEVLQDSTTANLIFGVDEIISHVTQTMTLEPGDLILTGTPAGVGVFRDPQRLLRAGDEVTIEIEGLGALTNPVVAG